MWAFEFFFFICLHPCLLRPWSRGCSLEDEEEATPQCEIGRDANPDRLVIKKPSERRKTQSGEEGVGGRECERRHHSLVINPG